MSTTLAVFLRACTALLLLSLAAHAQTRRPAPKASLAPLKDPAPTGPTVVIDTTLGRVTCALYAKQAPLTVANFLGLADGTKDWTNAGTVVHSKPFYDGLAFYGISDGITAGDRLGGNNGLAGPAFLTEKSGLGYERAGRLVMAKAQAANPADKSAPEMTSSSLFFLTAHADTELSRRGATIFGQCDDGSIPVIAALAHTLLSSDNHPDQPLAINMITVVPPGSLTPTVAAMVLPSAITPQPVPLPTANIPAPEPTGPTVVIDVAISATNKGQLTCRLFDKETPIATSNFIGLVNGTKDWNSPVTHLVVHGKRFYDGLTFRRVIPDFMVQNADMPGDPQGGGDIGFKFGNEVVPGLTFDRPGRLAYANAGPGTNASEFFVTEHPVSRLDGNYTIFGQCDQASVRLVEAIARVPRDEHNHPIKPVVIQRISIVAATK